MAPKQAAAAAAASTQQPPPQHSCRRQPTLLQRAAVASYVYFIPAFLLLNLALLTNRYTAALWLVWVAWINFGPGRWASKRATWPKHFRWLSWWRHCADYFPTRLIKTADLDPEGRYIFVVAPHGIVTMFCWPCFDTDSTGFSTKFPGIDIHPMTLEVNFRLPLMREFLLLHGVVDASRAACLMTLGKGPGQAILLAVGGAQEALLAQPGTYDVILNKRKGFVRIALQTGAKLVPVIGFGENDLYDVSEPGPVRRALMGLTKSLFGFTLPAPNGLGLLWGRGLMPYPQPLTTVVGPPVEFDPSAVLKAHPEDANLELFVDAYHAQYLTALRILWDAHKDNHAPGRRRSLDIVE